MIRFSDGSRLNVLGTALDLCGGCLTPIAGHLGRLDRKLQRCHVCGYDLAAATHRIPVLTTAEGARKLRAAFEGD